MIDKSRLGPFVLEQRLGQQKTGSVYHAVHLQRRRAMAVRLMSQHLGHSGVSLQEFAREVEFLKSLEHPNVVRVFGGGVFDDEAYIAMDLVKGESLDEVISAGGGLPWQTVVDYATQACEGLEYAHQRGTIHQNLSTAKLLLTPEGRIKITDFRGNRLNQYDRWEFQPHLAAVAYLAPEQLRGDKNISPKADIYALGCVIFELLTGRLPFEARTAHEMREKQLQEPPPRVSTLVFDCPIWLDALVAQMLEKDVNKRPHYASAVSQALHEVRRNAHTGIVEHAVSGSSALKSQVGDTAIKRLLKRKSAPRPEREWIPFYERVWFLSGCAALMIALCTWALWPASEEQLFAKADALMSTQDRDQWRTAREDYLEPLLKRFPESKHAAQARQYLERIELAEAQARAESPLRRNRRDRPAGERLYAQGWELEQDSKLSEALAVYQELVEQVEPKGEDAPFVILAQQQIATLKPAVALAAAAEKQEVPTEERSTDAPVEPSETPESAPAPAQAIPAATKPADSPT